MAERKKSNNWRLPIDSHLNFHDLIEATMYNARTLVCVGEIEEYGEVYQTVVNKLGPSTARCLACANIWLARMRRLYPSLFDDEENPKVNWAEDGF